MPPEGPLVLVHTGAFYPEAVDLVAFADGLAELVDGGQDVRIVHCGGSASVLRGLLRERGCEAVLDDRGRVSRQEAAELRSRASALLLFVPGRPQDAGAVPAKGYDYLASGKPLLTLGSPAAEGCQIVAEAGAGAPCDEAGAVTARLRELIAAQRAGRLDELAPSPAARDRHGPVALAETFARVLDAAVAG